MIVFEVLGIITVLLFLLFPLIKKIVGVKNNDSELFQEMIEEEDEDEDVFLSDHEDVFVRQEPVTAASSFEREQKSPPFKQRKLREMIIAREILSKPKSIEHE